MKKRPLTINEVASMGGKARRDNLTPEERSRAATDANRARWDNMTDEERQAFSEGARKRAIEAWKKRKKR